MHSAQKKRARFLGRISGKSLLLSLIVGALIVSACGSAQGSADSNATKNPSGAWKLVWSDEFTGASGSLPDAAKWTHEIGGNGFGNNELQYYTSRAENAQLSDGNLVITALQEEFTGSDGVTRQYTSARLKTAGKFSQKHGRFEARLKVPSTQGMWPAFWMLGADVAEVGWPNCGEIDIMESVGSAPGTVLGTLHGPGYSGSGGISKNFVLPNGQSFSDGFHTFAVEWEPSVIRFYVDDTLYATRSAADLPEGSRWVFEHPFFIILNLAVGGNLPGNPDATTVLPQRLTVDYVRVYSR